MLTQDAIRTGLAKPKTKADEEMAANHKAAKGNAAADNKADKAKAGKAAAKAEAETRHPMMPDLDKMKMPDLKALAKGMSVVVGFATTKKSLIKTLKAEYKKAAQQGK